MNTEFDILHPYIWFVPIFILYSIAYPIILLYENNVSNFDILTLRLEWIAICTFIIIVKNKKVKHELVNFIPKDKSIIPYVLLIACFIMSSLYILVILRTGMVSKLDVVSSNNIILVLGNMFVSVTMVPLTYICLDSRMKNSKKILMYVFFLGILFLSFSVNGQRAILISYLIAGAMIYNVVYKKISFIKCAIFAIVGLSSLAILANFKMFLVRDAAIQFNQENFIIQILSSDFQAASENLNKLILLKDTWAYKYGSTLVYDLLTPIDFLIPFDISKMSAINWYQNTYFATSKFGHGFTLVGEGYLNFGVYGVVIWYSILGYIVKIFYHKSNKNREWFTLYIILMIYTMYSNRADLASIFSPLFKYGVIPVILFAVIKIAIGRQGKRYANKKNRL